MSLGVCSQTHSYLKIRSEEQDNYKALLLLELPSASQIILRKKEKNGKYRDKRERGELKT